VPGPAIGRGGGRRAGRVKTRLLGFDSSIGAGTDPFEAAPPQAAAVVRFPVGWIVVVDGPGRGASFTLFNGVSAIGRGDDQPVKLDFGDTSISRTNHAVVAYDNEQRKFFLGHGGKANIVRLNGKPVLSTEELGTTTSSGSARRRCASSRCAAPISTGPTEKERRTAMLVVSETRFDVASAISQGQRPYQEDALVTDFSLGTDIGFAVLADGMGGHAAGDVASKIVVTEVFSELKLQSGDVAAFKTNLPEILRDAALAANDCVKVHIQSNAETTGWAPRCWPRSSWAPGSTGSRSAIRRSCCSGRACCAS
jgi:hypothetical protein